jgi:hypothetical protein
MKVKLISSTSPEKINDWEFIVEGNMIISTATCRIVSLVYPYSGESYITALLDSVPEIVTRYHEFGIRVYGKNVPILFPNEETVIYQKKLVPVFEGE